MSSTKGLIKAKLEELLQRRSTLEQRIEEMQMDRHDVHVQIRTLKGLYDEIDEPDGQDGPSESSGPMTESNGQLGATDAVRDLLKEHPDGLGKREIVRLLDGRIKSKSSDQRRLIYNTLINLRNRGDIEPINRDGVERYVISKRA